METYFSPSEFRDAVLLAQLPPRTSTQAVKGQLKKAMPCTLVDMYIETVLAVSEEDVDTELASNITPALVGVVMEELYDHGVTCAPVRARDVARCPSCPQGPVAVTALMKAINGVAPVALVDSMTAQAARHREAVISKHAAGWGKDAPAFHSPKAHYAAYLLLQSVGFPEHAMPKPRRIPSVGCTFRRICAELKW